MASRRLRLRIPHHPSERWTRQPVRLEFQGALGNRSRARSTTGVTRRGRISAIADPLQIAHRMGAMCPLYGQFAHPRRGAAGNTVSYSTVSATCVYNALGQMGRSNGAAETKEVYTGTTKPASLSRLSDPRLGRAQSDWRCMRTSNGFKRDAGPQNAVAYQRGTRCPTP